MAGDPHFFRDLALVLVAAVLGAGLAWLARQPLVLGYVLGGVAISPFTPGPAVADSLHHLEAFAEIGVVLLMFSLGLEFSLKDLLRGKWVALMGGSTTCRCSAPWSRSSSPASCWCAPRWSGPSARRCAPPCSPASGWPRSASSRSSSCRPPGRRGTINLAGARTPERAGRLPEMPEVTLGTGVLADSTLREARVRERFGVSVLAITRADGTLEANPSADTVLRKGDRVRLFGLAEQIRALLAYDAREDRSPRTPDGPRQARPSV
jgi:hypothetical protein